MVMNHVLKVVINKDQLEQLRYLARLNSSSLSSFVRQKIFNTNYELEKMIIEMHKKVMENG